MNSDNNNEQPVIIVRRSFKEKRDIIEQRLVTVADLAILVERLKEQLRDYDAAQHKHCDNGKRRAILLSELRFARLAHNNATKRAS